MSKIGNALPQAIIGEIGKPEFTLRVNMGLIPGFSPIDKFGANFTVSADSVHQDIWEGLTDYTFSTSSDINKLSSSSIADVGHLIKIAGIRDPETSDDEDTGYAQLNGQSKVNIFDNPELTGDPISFFRVYRMENEEKAVFYGGLGPLTGMVYCYVDTAISGGVPTDVTKRRAIINDGNNQTQMAIYTSIPKHVSFLYRGEVGLEFDAPQVNPQAMRIQYQSARYQRIFKVKKPITLQTTGNTIYQDKRSFEDILPALTDIRITKTFSSAAMGAFAAFDILAVDEKLFSTAYLAAIGQPGY